MCELINKLKKAHTTSTPKKPKDIYRIIFSIFICNTQRNIKKKIQLETEKTVINKIKFNERKYFSTIIIPKPSAPYLASLHSYISPENNNNNNNIEKNTYWRSLKVVSLAKKKRSVVVVIYNTVFIYKTRSAFFFYERYNRSVKIGQFI